MSQGPLCPKLSQKVQKEVSQIIQGRKPHRLRTDAAKDFTSKVFQEYLKSKDIAHFTTHSEKQANYVE